MRSIVSALLLLCASQSFGQTSSSTASSSATASNPGSVVVAQSLAVLGGSSAVQQSQNAVAIGSLTEGSKQQTFVLKNAPSEFSYEYRDSDGQLAGRVFSNHGEPKAANQSKVRPFFKHAAYIDFPPHLVAAVLFRRAADPHAVLTYNGAVKLPSGDADTVEIKIDADDFTRKFATQTWYFDRATHLPVQVDYLAPDLTDPDASAKITAVFESYATHNGTLMPAKVTLKIEGSETPLVYMFDSIMIGAATATDFEGGAN